MVMAKTTTKRRTTAVKPTEEKDTTYLLKIALYLLVGAFWVTIIYEDTVIPLPLGFLLGLAFASHDHFKMDRKIEYAILVVGVVVGFVTGYGMRLAFNNF
jgi:hypothetical protein